MPMFMPMRNIDKLQGSRAKVFLKNGRVVTGEGDCICWLPNDEDEDIDDEVIKFDINDDESIFFTDEEIEKIELLD